MTGPRQAAELVRLAIRAGLDAEVYHEQNVWTAIVGDLGGDVAVSWRRRDGRWTVESATRDEKPVGYGTACRLVRKGLR